MIILTLFLMELAYLFAIVLSFAIFIAVVYAVFIIVFQMVKHWKITLVVIGGLWLMGMLKAILLGATL